MNAPLIPEFLDRRPLIWSYSMLHNFRDVCPHQGQARYIDKSIQFVETEAVRWGNAVHSAFEQRVGGGKPLPLDMQQWEAYAAPFDNRGAIVENWFYIDDQGKACDRFAKNKAGHGKLDMVILNGNTAYIGDWKTGNGKYEDAFELEIGALLLHAKHPHLTKIVGNYFWLKENRISKLYDLSNTTATWQEVCRITKQILDWRASGDFPKKQSGLCGYCQRWDCDKNSNQDRPQ